MSRPLTMVLVVCTALLLSVVFTSRPAPQESASRTCKVELTASDLSPDNPFKQHMKRLRVDSDLDLTSMYSAGRAYITYGRADGGDAQEDRFDHSSRWVQPQSRNQWGLRTTWADLHPGWVEGLWFVWYQC